MSAAMSQRRNQQKTGEADLAPRTASRRRLPHTQPEERLRPPSSPVSKRGKPLPCSIALSPPDACPVHRGGGETCCCFTLFESRDLFSLFRAAGPPYPTFRPLNEHDMTGSRGKTASPATATQVERCFSRLLLKRDVVRLGHANPRKEDTYACCPPRRVPIQQVS